MPNTSNLGRAEESPSTTHRTCPVVAIGSSAGGLEALEQFFANTPPEPGAAFVVVSHLAPSQPSLLPELLARKTAMPVVAATDGVRVEPNHVYVIAPNSTLTLAGDVLRAENHSDPRANPIDTFFRSLAEARGPRAVGIVLSGTGSDGSLGLRAIKEHGGLVMAQELESAKYDSMPRSAIAESLVDWILPAAAMPARLTEYLSHLDGTGLAPGAPPLPADRDQQESLLRQLCALVQRKTGHDFSQYKRTTLLRRIERRMHVLQRPTFASYIELLDETPAELERLFQELLIGVTQFFRDPAVFELLAREILPRLVANRAPDAPVRVWVPGCATGEEAYSLAMLLSEALSGRDLGVKIFATDIDEVALDVARAGRYPETIAAHVSPERLHRHFVPRRDGGWQVSKSLREMCVFSSHNVTSDPPFSQIDLISCRNLLIYLESELQRSIFPVFHYSLRPGGFLLLGPSETAAAAAELFTRVDPGYCVFQRRETVTPVKFRLGTRRVGGRPEDGPRGPPMPPNEGLSRRLERLLLARYTLPAVIVRRDGEIVFVAGQTRKFLELAPGAAGTNVREMADRELRPHLHALLHEAATRREERVRRGVTLAADGRAQRVDIAVRPLQELGPEADLYAVVFQSVGPELSEEQAEVEGLSAAGDGTLVACLEAELRSTRENLQTTVEELEASNEELTSTNEELLSTNEELQSTNEELQTSKEELQSINEELQTVNAELNHKVDELDKSNADLQNLFGSTRIAIVFLDNELKIKSFSPDATQMFCLRDSDVGRPITHIVATFDDADLVADVRGVIRTQTPSQREVRRRDAEVWYLQRIQPYRTAENVSVGVVLTFVDITELRAARDAARRLAAIVESSHDAIVGLGSDGVIESWNRGAELVFGHAEAEAVGQRLSALLSPSGPAEFDAPSAAVLRGERVRPLTASLTRKDGSPVRVLVSMSPIANAAGGQAAMSWIARDITEQERDREALRESRERFDEIHKVDRRKTEFLALLAHELRNPLTPIRNAVHLLRESSAIPPALRRSVDMIERQTVHMAKLVDDLLDVSRIARGKIVLKRQPLDLVDLARTVVRDHGVDADARGVSVEFRAPDAPLPVFGDPTRLTQCVGNVLANALKFTDRGGHIVVAVEREGDAALVVVRDTGVGMDEETLAHAFEPFSQAERHLSREAGGLGLGLALVKALVEQHGGSVAARSGGPGQGTEMSLRLPLSSAEQPGSVRSPPAPPRAGSEPRRVLVIEDNVDVAESTRSLLEMWGHTATIAGTGPDGVKAALADPPDLVLCDLSLAGGMNGLDVCRALRAAAETRTARIVAVTGHGSRGDELRVREAGFDLHLIKPVDPELLERVVQDTPRR